MKPTGRTDRSSHIALVCAGGGITGGVFEVGALQALDRALGGGVVADLDSYTGTSAGSIVATLLAAGLQPWELYDVMLRGSQRHKLPALKRTDIYGLDMSDWAVAAARLPAHLLGGFVESLRPGETGGAADAFFSALSSLPAGLFTNEPLGRYMSHALKQLEVSERFHDFPRTLYITAMDIDTGHRVVFGERGVRDVPVPTAVRASAAVPMMFTPVRCNGQDFIDGGIERNLPVDVPVRHGAGLVIAINPLVPIVNDTRDQHGKLLGKRYIRNLGIPAVLDQTFRSLIRSQTLYALQALRERYPEVDLVLIEPEAHDSLMFSYHIMRFSVREQIMEHSYSAAKKHLIREDEHLKAMFARHGLDFDVRRLGKVSDPPKARPTWAERLSQSRLVRKLLATDQAAPEPF